MKKFLFMLLAAIAFVGCGKDDVEVPQNGGNGNGGNNQGILANVPNYSDLIDMSYSNLIKTLGEPTTSFSNYLSYENPADNVTFITLAVNPKTQTVYLVMEMLKEDAFKLDELKKYFDAKYTFVNVEADEEEGTIYAYNYSNADGSLTITVSESSITYMNPANMPEEVESGSIDGTPVEVVSAIMGQTIEYLMEEYPGVITQFNNIYMINYEDDPYLMCVMIDASSDVITKLTILYNEDLEDDALVAYYQEEGYTCLPTGNVNDEGKAEYLFMDMSTGIMIKYCDSIGEVLDMSAIDDEGEDEDEDEDEED